MNAAYHCHTTGMYVTHDVFTSRVKHDHSLSSTDVDVNRNGIRRGASVPQPNPCPGGRHRNPVSDLFSVTCTYEVRNGDCITLEFAFEVKVPH